METLSLLFVIIPLTLIAFFVYLLFGKKVSSDTLGNSNHRSNGMRSIIRFIVTISIIVVAVGGLLAFIKFYKMPCPTSISPEEFSKVVNGTIDEKAELFHMHNFINDCPKCNSRIGEFKYIKGERNYDDIDQKYHYSEIDETIENLDNYPGWMRYEITNKTKFLNFFKYLISVGAKDTLMGANPKPGTNLIYNGAIFENRGFNMNTERYKIFIANKDSL